MSGEQYTDDTTISDDAVLWRRIILAQCYREDDGTVRPSSAAFNNHRNCTPMSVALEDVFYQETSNDPHDYIKGHDNVVALTSFTAGLARELKQGIAEHHFRTNLLTPKYLVKNLEESDKNLRKILSG